MDPRKFLSVAAFGWVLFLAHFADGAEKLRFALDWLPLANNTPFYTAIDKGFYREAGLDVDIHRGFGSHDTAKKVLSGAMDLGVADVNSILIARTDTARNVIVSIVMDKGLNIVHTLKGSGITKPSDLSGRTIGDSLGGAGIALFPAFAEVNKIRDWQFVPMAPEAKPGMLLTGNVDAILMVAVGTPALEALARDQGKEIVGFLYSDYGLDIYGKGIFARDRTIQERREVVRGFVQAAMKGFAWTIEHPEESLSLFLNRHPTLNQKFEKPRWAIAQDALLTPYAKKHGIGVVDPEKMRTTVRVVAQAYKLEGKLRAEEVYTNEFLPRLFPKAPRGD